MVLSMVSSADSLMGFAHLIQENILIPVPNADRWAEGADMAHAGGVMGLRVY